MLWERQTREYNVKEKEEHDIEKGTRTWRRTQRKTKGMVRRRLLDGVQE